jgi:hypothetical protein
VPIMTQQPGPSRFWSDRSDAAARHWVSRPVCRTRVDLCHTRRSCPECRSSGRCRESTRCRSSAAALLRLRTPRAAGAGRCTRGRSRTQVCRWAAGFDVPSSKQLIEEERWTVREFCCVPDDSLGMREGVRCASASEAYRSETVIESYLAIFEHGIQNGEQVPEDKIMYGSDDACNTFFLGGPARSTRCVRRSGAYHH